MDLYEVRISPKAQEQLEQYVDYIQHTLFNEQAAMDLWQDAMETVAKLKTAAGSLQYCKTPLLAALRYRAIPFLRHRYVMLFRLEGRAVFVDAVYHQLQNYENLFLGRDD